MDEAARLIRLAALGGDRDAQYRLALLHGTGQGVARSDKLALDWLRKAARQRQADAQYLLAAVYMQGKYGVERDEKQGVEWLRRAALNGNLDAAYELGIAYAEGRGVPRDGSESYGWMLLAARGGHAQAMAFVREIQRARTPVQPPAMLPDAAPGPRPEAPSEAPADEEWKP
jgi:TPR repeat protein